MLSEQAMYPEDTKVHTRWIPGATASYAVVVAVVLALMIGIVVPFYADAMGYKPARLLALPAFLLFGFLLLFNRLMLLTLIILFRSAGDVVLDSTRFSIGGYETGVGGVINLCVILLACMLVIEKPAYLPKKMVISWTPFLLVGLFGTLISPDKADAMKIYLPLLSYFAMFVSAFYFVQSTQDFRRCIKLVVWSSVLPALYGVVDVVLHHGAGGEEGFRLQSTFTHPNIFAFYLMLVIPLTLYLIKDKATQLSGSTRIVLSLYMVFLLALLVLTQTRSAWIACIIMFVAYALFFERRYLWYLMLLPAAVLFIPEIRDRLVDLESGNHAVGYAKLNSFAWRLSLWESGLQWMQPSHYLFGYGVEAFKHYSQTFFLTAGKTDWGAHNVFVQWFFDAGVIGLIAYLWLYTRMVMVFKSLMRVDRLASFIGISIVIMYLIVSFSDNMFAYLVFNWYFWFAVGIACALAAHVVPSAKANDARRSNDHAQSARPS